MGCSWRTISPQKILTRGALYSPASMYSTPENWYLGGHVPNSLCLKMDKWITKWIALGAQFPRKQYLRTRGAVYFPVLMYSTPDNRYLGERGSSSLYLKMDKNYTRMDYTRRTIFPYTMLTRGTVSFAVSTYLVPENWYLFGHECSSLYSVPCGLNSCGQ